MLLNHDLAVDNKKERGREGRMGWKEEGKKQKNNNKRKTQKKSEGERGKRRA